MTTFIAREEDGEFGVKTLYAGSDNNEATEAAVLAFNKYCYEEPGEVEGSYYEEPPDGWDNFVPEIGVDGIEEPQWNFAGNTKTIINYEGDVVWVVESVD